MGSLYSIKPLVVPNAESYGEGINEAGDVVGYRFEDDFKGVIWSAGSPPQKLVVANYLFSELLDINNHNTAVGWGSGYYPDSIHSISVKDGTVTILDNEIGPKANPTGINDSGLICGWQGWNSFIYNSNTEVFTAIEPLPGAPSSRATAINAAGDVVGWSGDPVDGVPGNHGFIYLKDELRDLGEAIRVEDVNDHGRVAGSKATGAGFPETTAVVWNTSVEPFVFNEIAPPIGFTGGFAQGINNYNTEGIVVGTCWTELGDSSLTAFVYYPDSGSFDLNNLIPTNSSWHLISATKINNGGQITGSGLFNGVPTAFLLTPKIIHQKTDPTVHFFEFLWTLVSLGVEEDGGGLARPGGHIGPWGPLWDSLSVSKREIALGLAVDQLAMSMRDGITRDRIRTAALQSVRAQVDVLLRSVRHVGTMEAKGAPRFKHGKLVRPMEHMKKS